MNKGTEDTRILATARNHISANLKALYNNSTLYFGCKDLGQKSTLDTIFALVKRETNILTKMKYASHHSGSKDAI